MGYLLHLLEVKLPYDPVCPPVGRYICIMLKNIHIYRHNIHKYTLLHFHHFMHTFMHLKIFNSLYTYHQNITKYTEKALHLLHAAATQATWSFPMINYFQSPCLWESLWVSVSYTGYVENTARFLFLHRFHNFLCSFK